MGRAGALLLLVLLAAPLAVFAPLNSASAQTQDVTVKPGYINLGMTTSIQVTAPAAGTYTLTVQMPDGTESALNMTFASAGGSQTTSFGNASSGFKSSVNQVGTYDVAIRQGAKLVSSTSFYATNKLVVSMDMVTGGTCDYISGVIRGEKLLPRFYVTYASNNAPLTKNVTGAYVTYTLPSGTKANASWHNPTAEAPDQGGSGGSTGFYIGKVQPTWNYTSIGPWSPVVMAGDAYGNTATYRYTGPAFVIMPAQLATDIQVTDASTGQPVADLVNGQAVVISATITYPTNPEPVSGFVGPLDVATRGGTVAAQVGWGFYNTTSGSFGGATAGGLLGTVLMTYTGSNGTWTGQFESNSLPSLPAGASYEVVVSSQDKASPPNTGFAISALTAGTSQTTTVSSISTVVSTATSITTVVSQSTQQAVQTVQSIPNIVYAALAILLVIGVLVGYIVRVPR